MKRIAILAALGAMMLTACTTTGARENLQSEGTQELAFTRSGDGPYLLVFVHGNGNATSADWAPIIERLDPERTESIAIDRAGHGDSALFDLPYRVEDEVDALVRIVREEARGRPVVLVGHSFGGLISAKAAARLPDLAGLIFVDAPVPGAFTPEMARTEYDRYAPQFAMLRERAPELAAAIIPVLERFPEIAADYPEASYPDDLPTIVIDAEGSTFEDAASLESEERLTRQFVAASPYRFLMPAPASGHQVMVDRPDIVMDAIEYMIAQAAPAR